MNRPSLLWIIFALCLLLIVPAMIWLTMTAMRLDRKIHEDSRQTELARREIELQEKITSALYRMDWKLGPLISKEASLPYYMYESFYRDRFQTQQKYANGEEPNGRGGGGGGTGAGASFGATTRQPLVPSPLLYQESPLVKLHFQIKPSGKSPKGKSPMGASANEKLANFTSPQRPVGEANVQNALTCCGIGPSEFAQKDVLLKTLSSFCSYSVLTARLQQSEAQFADVQNSSWSIY